LSKQIRKAVSKEVKVALFVLIVAAMFVFGMNFLKGKGFFDNNSRYYAIFDQVGGMYKSDPIVVNGYQIGKMGELQLINNGVNRGKILAEMVISNNIQIPSNSLAILFSADLLGEMNVKLIYDEETTTFHQDGDTVSTKIEGSLFEELGGELTPITEKLSTTMDNVNALFDFENENQQTLNYTLQSINDVLDTYNATGAILNKRLDGQLETLDALLKNVESLTSTLKGNEENINEIMTNFKDLSVSLNKLDLEQTLNNVNGTVSSLETTIGKMNSTDNTLGALLNERQMYDNLEKSTESLNVLLNDVRINPKRYININVFGGKKKEIPPITSADLE
jgi:phospholipid/cholesterol/gamma-HCH transport system substrate-binding protein